MANILRSVVLCSILSLLIKTLHRYNAEMYTLGSNAILSFQVLTYSCRTLQKTAAVFIPADCIVSFVSQFALLLMEEVNDLHILIFGT